MLGNKVSKINIHAKKRGMNLLKEYRDKNKLSKLDMSNRLGVAYSSYDYYENKAQGMDFAIQVHICETLGITPDKFFASIKKEFYKNLKIEVRQVVSKPRGRPRKTK